MTYCGEPAQPAQSIFVLIPNRTISENEARQLAAGLTAFFKTYVVTSSLPKVDEVLSFAELLSEKLSDERIRWATVCGIGPGASIAQALALVDTKVIRRLILVDATTRLAPGLRTRIIDRIERFLPLGLPLRTSSKEFDARPMLHRIHRPTMVVVTSQASTYVKSQCALVARNMPTAWLSQLSLTESGGAAIDPKGLLSSELLSLINQFVEVPAKRPLKNAA